MQQPLALQTPAVSYVARKEEEEQRRLSIYWCNLRTQLNGALVWLLTWRQVHATRRRNHRGATPQEDIRTREGCREGSGLSAVGHHA